MWILTGSNGERRRSRKKSLCRDGEAEPLRLASGGAAEASSADVGPRPGLVSRLDADSKGRLAQGTEYNSSRMCVHGTLPSTVGRYFTGLTIDPTQGLLYAAVTPSSTQAGYAVRYRGDGNVVDSIKVGISPNGFFFQ